MNYKTISMSVLLAALLIGSGGLWLYQTNNEKEKNDSVVKKTNYRKEVKIKEKNEAIEQVKPKAASTQAITEEDENKYKTSTKSEKATGYIKALYGKKGKNYIDIDYIQYFDGKDAINAIRQDKMSSGYDYSEEMPNGFYIRNNNPKIRTFQLSKYVRIKIRYEFETSATGEKTVSYEEFKSKYDSKELYKEIPVDIIVKGEAVTELVQKFIP